MASPCRLSPCCLHTGFTPVLGDMAPKQSWMPQCIAVSVETLPDLPQMITLWCFGLVSNEIWSSGASSYKVCALKSQACGAPFSTDSSQIWFVCESRCQTQMPSHQKLSRSTLRCFKPLWEFLLQAYLFQLYHTKNWDSNLLTCSVLKHCNHTPNKHERKQELRGKKKML